MKMEMRDNHNSDLETPPEKREKQKNLISIPGHGEIELSEFLY